MESQDWAVKEIRLEMPPRGQMVEGGGSLYCVSNMLNIPERFTAHFCACFCQIDQGLCTEALLGGRVRASLSAETLAEAVPREN